MLAIFRTLALAAVLGLFLPPVGAQEQQSRFTGRITDGSGGALPGVTVTITSTRLRAVTVITDGAGRFLSPALPSDTYTLTFVLSGFETLTSSGVSVKAGEVVIVDQQMGLASLAETVEVVAAAPPPPPPPPPPAPLVELPKRPQPRPVQSNSWHRSAAPSRPPAEPALATSWRIATIPSGSSMATAMRS